MNICKDFWTTVPKKCLVHIRYWFAVGTTPPKYRHQITESRDFSNTLSDVINKQRKRDSVKERAAQKNCTA